MPYSKKLKGTYFKKWTPPEYATSSSSSTWYIYTIIGIVIVALIVIIIVSIARWRHLRSFYKDGYQPIKNRKVNKNTTIEKEEEIKKLLKNTKDNDTESDNDNDNMDHDAAEYTHIDSNRSKPDINTALITVEN